MSSPPLPARDWPIPPMDKAPGHKPSAFTWAMGRLILQRMADRETMKQITADPRMPAYCTVFTWVRMNPDFGDAYRQVRAALAEVAREEAEGRRAAVVRGRALERARAGKPPRDWVSGRASTYTPQMADAVCAAVAAGASVTEVVRTPGMPSFKALYTWLRRRPDFRAQFIDACSWRECGLAAQITETIDDATPGDLREVRARVRSLEARIGRITPKLYRPRQPLPAF